MKGWLGCRAGRRKGTHWRMFGVDAFTKGSVHCQHPTHMRELVPAIKARALDACAGLASHHDGEHAKVEVRADVEAGGDADCAVVPRVLVRLLPLRAAPVQHHPAAVTKGLAETTRMWRGERKRRGLTV